MIHYLKVFTHLMRDFQGGTLFNRERTWVHLEKSKRVLHAVAFRFRLLLHENKAIFFHTIK